LLCVGDKFKSTPKFYHKLFTINGLSDDHYLPLAFFLLASEIKSYEDVFRYTSTVSEAATPLSLRWAGRFDSQHGHLLDKYSHQVLGLSNETGKKDSELSHFLEKIFGLSLYHRRMSATVLLLVLYPIFRKTSE
jgi:hypothetical protein